MPRGGFRPGAGRKPLEKQRVSKLILAHTEEWDTIKAAAEKHGLSVNEYVLRKSLGGRVDAENK